METVGSLAAAVIAYAAVFAAFCVRYFTVVGGVYVLLQVVCKRRWLARRIQAAFPPRRDVFHEIRWSLINGAVTGLTALLLYRLIGEGRTALYFDVADRGWLYLAATVVAGILGYETWIYWEHRLLHTPWLYRHVHAVHHVTNPTAFAALSRHPVEACLEQLYFVLAILFVPLHPLAVAAMVIFFFANGIVAHMGYEFYPEGFARHRLWGWLNSSTYHNMHHSLEGCHYGNAFNFWDRWLGTYHPAYLATFAAVKARLEPRTAGVQAAAVEAEPAAAQPAS